jgi:hypothetical protein
MRNKKTGGAKKRGRAKELRIKFGQVNGYGIR